MQPIKGSGTSVPRGVARRSVMVGVASAASLAMFGRGRAAASGLTGVDDAVLQPLVAAAKAEGALTIYSSESGAQVDASAADFQARFGIKVEATRLVSGDLTPRYAAELKSGRVVADVVSLSATPFFTDNSAWWLKVDDHSIPGIAGFPTKAYGENYITVTQQGMVIAYNTDLIKPAEVPKGYKDLLAERFAGQGTIVIADPRATQTGMSFYWAMIQRLGPDYYKAMMKQEPAIGPGAVAVAQLVGAGANAVGIGTFSNHVQTVAAAGGPIKCIYPPELATGSDNQIAVSAKAPHPNAARLFAAYRISREGQEALCKIGGSASPLGQVAGCEPPAPADYVQTNYQIWNDRAWQAANLPLIGLAPQK